MAARAKKWAAQQAAMQGLGEAGLPQFVSKPVDAAHEGVGGDETVPEQVCASQTAGWWPTVPA